MPVSAIALVAACLVSQTASQPLTASSYEAWKNRLAKVVTDAPYRQVNWARTLASAMRVGIDGKKPVLVWLSRGHPLAMTSTHGVRMRSATLADTALQAKLRNYSCVALSIEEFEDQTGFELDMAKQLPTTKNATHRFEGFALYAPTGKLLGTTSSLDAPEIVAQLTAFESIPGGEMPKDYRDAWLQEPDNDTPDKWQYLRFLSQDLPREAPLTGWQAKAWNFGYAALTPESIEELAPDSLRTNESHTVDEDLVKFLGQYIFVDAVRGIPTSFISQDVRGHALTTTLESEDKGQRVFVLKGQITSTTKGEWCLDADDEKAENSEQIRGVDLAVRGRVRFDIASKKLVTFEIVALGTRWGGSPLNGRKDDTRVSEFSVLVNLVEPNVVRHIPTIFEDD